jgi:general stress protein 26
MHSQPRLSFLQQKIMDLEQALFFNMSQAVLKLPVSIVTALHVDEVGHVWFMVRRPTQKLNEFDREFLARLEFYKKGKDFFLQVSGKACLVTDPEEIHNALHLPEEVRYEASSTMVLVKLKIAGIHYYPYKVKPVRILSDIPKFNLHPLTFFKSLHYIVKDIIPVFQSH